MADATAALTSADGIDDFIAKLDHTIQVIRNRDRITITISDRNQRLLAYVIGIPVALILTPLFLMLLWALATGPVLTADRFTESVHFVVQFSVLSVTIGNLVRGIMLKLGPEVVELTTEELCYSGGSGFFRHHSSIDWGSVAGFRPNPKPAIGAFDILFDGGFGSKTATLGICRNLPPHNIPYIIAILSAYRASLAPTTSPQLS